MLKKILPRGLFARTILILILPIFLLQGFGIYLFYERHWDKLAQRLSSSVAGDIGLIAEWYEADGDWLDAGQRVRIRRYIDLDARAGEHDKGAQTASYSYLKTALRSTLDGRQFRLSNPGGDNLTAIIHTARGPVTIEVPKRRLYSSTTKIFVMWLVGLTVLLATIAALFLQRQIKPILRLASSAWSARAMNGPLKLEGAEEVRLATAAFNDMHERLKRHSEQRNAILTGVREDLQKPIDRLKLTLDTVLPSHPDTPTMMSDLREMERMIDGYLSYVRDNRDEPISKTSLKGILDEAQRLSGVKHMTIEFNDVEMIQINARPLALTRAFANLMRYAGMREAGLLAITARPIETDDSQLVLMSFEDNGPPIDDKTIRETLHPLSKTGGQARDFGLAIASDIVEGHGGTLELSKGVKGARVSLVIPA